jgi:ADP-heptose:LPS heptosyltransferase
VRLFLDPAIKPAADSRISHSNYQITRLPDHPIEDPTRILLVRLRQIGDVVFTTPAIHALRRRFPGAHLTYIVEPPAAAVVIHNPHLDEVIVAPHRTGVRGFADDVALGWRLRKSHYDLAIDFHGGPRASLLTWLSGARTRIGYHIIGRSWMYTQRVPRPRALRPRHSVENQWDLLSLLDISATDRVRFPVEMPIDAEAARTVSDRLANAGVAQADRVVVVHVSAGNPFRRWPGVNFVRLITALVQSASATRVIVTAGPSERNAAERVIAEARAELGGAGAYVLSCGEFSLAELRALFDRAALFIGGDSGPLHIAATSTVPIVGLYGPTLPMRSAPWRDDRWTTASIDAGDMPCRPCHQRVCAPGDFRCLTSIAPEQVIDVAIRTLNHGVAARM